MPEAKRTGLSNHLRREDMKRAVNHAPPKRSPDDKHWYHHVESQRSSVANEVRGIRIFAASVSVETQPSILEQDLISDVIMSVITGRHKRDEKAQQEGGSVTA